MASRIFLKDLINCGIGQPNRKLWFFWFFVRRLNLKIRWTHLYLGHQPIISQIFKIANIPLLNGLIDPSNKLLSRNFTLKYLNKYQKSKFRGPLKFEIWLLTTYRLSSTVQLVKRYKFLWALSDMTAELQEQPASNIKKLIDEFAVRKTSN